MKTQSQSPGTWSGLQCQTRFGSLVNVIGRRAPERSGDFPAVWAVRMDDKALRAYLLADLRFEDGITPERMARIEAMPELSDEQAHIAANTPWNDHRTGRTA